MQTKPMIDTDLKVKFKRFPDSLESQPFSTAHKLTDFESMNLIIDRFNKTFLTPSENREEELRIVIRAAYVFLEDFNFQIRILFAMRQIAKEGVDLSNLDLIVPLIVSFNRHKENNVFFQTFVDILYFQLQNGFMIDHVDSKTLFSDLIKTAKKQSLSRKTSEKIVEILMAIPQNCQTIKSNSDIKWLVELIMENLKWIKNEDEKEAKESSIFNFLNLVSKTALFAPFLWENSFKFLSEYQNHILDTLCIVDNVLLCRRNSEETNLRDFSSFETQSKIIFPLLCQIVLSKKQEMHLIIKIIRILTKNARFAAKYGFDDNFLDHLKIIVQLHPQKKVILPTAKDLIITICLLDFPKNPNCIYSTMVSEKYPDGIKVVLSVTENHFLMIKQLEEKEFDTGCNSDERRTLKDEEIEINSVKNVHFGYCELETGETDFKDSIFGYQNFGADPGKEKLELKIWLDLNSDFYYKFIFEVSCENIRFVNPLVEVFTRTRELDLKSNEEY